MDAVQDMGGATSKETSSRLLFPLNGKELSERDHRSILDLIKEKEDKRLEKSKIQSLMGSKMVPKKTQSTQPVITFAKDPRNHQRKERLTKKFVHDSVLLKQHHSKQTQEIKREIFRTFKKIFELEKELEDARQDLALRPDFIPTQLFAFFDASSR